MLLRAKIGLRVSTIRSATVSIRPAYLDSVLINLSIDYSNSDPSMFYRFFRI